MKKKISCVLICAVLLGLLALSGCGGSAEPSPLDGRWIGVGAEMFGLKIPVEEAFGGQFTIDIQGTGKALVTVGDVDEKDKWELEGDSFTLHMRGADCVGTLDGDTIVFDNMLDSGVAIIFAKEGTAAADPALYDNVEEVIGEAVDEAVEEAAGEASDNEDESAPVEYVRIKSDDMLLGPWHSAGYSLSPEDPVSDDVSALELSDISELFRVNIKDDHTADVDFYGDEYSVDWYIEGDKLCFEEPDIQFDIMYRSDGILEIFMLADDAYMELYCQRD